MEGPNSNLLYDESEFKVHELSGILPRTADFLFQEVYRLQKQFKREFSISVSSLEIYCENVRDLFSTDNDEQSLNLVTIKGNKVVVQNQTWRKVNSTREFLELIKLSSSKRVFATNGANEHSSRSHHVFQIRIRGQNKAFQDVESLLNIVDLAGSERRFESINGQANAQVNTGEVKRNASKNAKLNTSTNPLPNYLKKETI